jgi:DHA1 family arabinose polymer transporter-like MFS transporter
MFGNAGVFAWFSYIKPFMINVSGFGESAIIAIMLLAGWGWFWGIYSAVKSPSVIARYVLPP